MPPQILRLVLLTVGIVTSYLIARYFLTPPSFGELGWYRANALGLVADRPLTYAGKEACDVVCHGDQVKKLSQGSHKTLSCEGCHGPGADHAESPDLHKLSILTFSHCVRCHGEDPSRPKWHKQINPKTHYAGFVCTECHVPHQPSETP
jgi:hypothetical protein